MKLKCEYHFVRADGLATYLSGVLTADHAASSRGLPVFIPASTARRDDLVQSGKVLGPAELPPLNCEDKRYVGLVHLGGRTQGDLALLRAAAAAGYPVQPQSLAPQNADDIGP